MYKPIYKKKTGKPIQLKDLKKLRSSCKYSQSDIENVVKILTQDDGISQVAVNENGDLLGIYHQTPYTWAVPKFFSYIRF